MERKHKTAATSIECYNEIKETGQIKREQDLIYELVKEHQPVSCKELSRLSEIEVTNVSRCLTNLKNQDKVKALFKERNPFGKKKIAYYTLMDWKINVRLYGYDSLYR